MKILWIVLISLISASNSALAAIECGTDQKVSLHRYTEAGNAKSKVTTVKIISSADSTSFIDTTGSKRLVIGMDGEFMSAKRTGNKYVVNRSLLNVYELNIEWVDHPFEMSGEVMIAKMYDTQYITTNENGCLEFRDGNSEH